MNCGLHGLHCGLQGGLVKPLQLELWFMLNENKGYHHIVPISFSIPVLFLQYFKLHPSHVILIARLVGMGHCETHGYMMSKQCAESCKFCQHHKVEILRSIGWSEWGAWSICDVVCGEGVRYR